MEGWRVFAHFDENEWLNFFAWARRKGLDVPAEPKSVFRPLFGEPGPNPAPACLKAEYSVTAWTKEKSIDFLRATRPERPWVLHCGFFRPHPPFSAPDPWHDMVALDRCGTAIKAADADDHPLLGLWLREQNRSSYFQGAHGQVWPLSPEEIALTQQAYFGLIAEVDDAIGQILQELERTGQAANTIIVFTSDHGEQLGDHGLLGKLGWFDQSYHLPLIIADPARPDAHGTVVSAFSEGVDLMPTLLDTLDIADPAYAGLLTKAASRMLTWRMRHADRTLTHLCTTPNGLVDRRVLAAGVT